MKKYVIIWIIATFVITAVLGFGIINPRLNLNGVVSYLLSAAEFVVVGLILYGPIKKKFE